MPGTTTNDERLDQALAAIQDLQAEVARLRDELAGEVRTRRLVVLDEHGRERIYTQVAEDAAELHVTQRYGDGEFDVAEVHITARSYDGNLASAEVALNDQGTTHAILELDSEEWVRAGGQLRPVGAAGGLSGGQEQAVSAHEQLVAAIEATLAECDSSGWNLPEALSRALTEVAGKHGSYRLVEHRPGCWEAEHVRALDLSELYR